MLHWGIIDTSITAAVSTIFRHSPEMKETEIPRAWSRRISFVKKAGKSASSLSELRQDIHNLCEACEKIAVVRDYVCHGYVSGYVAEPERKLIFRKIDTDKNKTGHEQFSLDITLSAFLSYAYDSANVASGTLNLNKRLSEIFVREKTF